MQRPTLKLGCWNIWTLMNELSEDLQDISDVWKTAVINELKRLNVGIAMLQKTCLADMGMLKESAYPFIWHGKAPEDIGKHGVHFTVRNALLKMAEPCTNGSG